MVSAVAVSLTIPIVFAVAAWGAVGCVILKFKFPGRGLKGILNIFKAPIPFGKAVRMLEEGKRIRRKSQRRGYTKIFIADGKNKKETYGTYYAGSKDDAEVSDYCSFSLEEVLAADWIIDE